jgi:predicted esterase
VQVRAWFIVLGGLLLGCQAPTGGPSGSASSAPSAAPSSSAQVGVAAASAASAAPAPSSSSAPPPPLPAGLEYHALVQEKVGFYATLLPPGYEDAAQRSKRFPVVVILHGSGSTELKHGQLAETFGREGVIYVLPRAPHAHEEVFSESKEPGWTAWPTYPRPWGKFDSPTFPKSEMAAIDVGRLYIDWIRDCVQDARKRYRTDGGRVLVIGHSQGAAFAHSLAVVYPDLVKAYFAYAGYYDQVPPGFDVAKIFKTRHVTAFIAHHEADTTVKVEKTRALLDYFRQNGVEHTGLVLPGGDHRMSDRIKDEARRFIDVQSCRASTSPCPR